MSALRCANFPHVPVIRWKIQTITVTFGGEYGRILLPTSPRGSHSSVRASRFSSETLCPRPLHPSTSTAFHCGNSSPCGASRTHLSTPDLSIHHGLTARFCFDKRPHSSLNCYGDDPRHGCLMSAAIRHTSFDCFDMCPYSSVNTAPCCASAVHSMYCTTVTYFMYTSLVA